MSDANVKILIPILNFGCAGGNRVLSELANHWISAGHKVDFLVNRVSPLPYFPTQAGIKWATSLGRIVSESKCGGGSSGTINGLSNIFSLYRALSHIGKNYNVILANHSLTAWPVALAECGTAKKFYYIQAYEPEYYEERRGKKARMYEWLSTKSYGLDLHQICNAPIYINYKNVRAVEWVPPGINFDLFQQKKGDSDFFNKQEIILGCIGRREPAKGIKFVLEAFERLYENNKKFRLHVAFGNLPEGWVHSGLKIVMPQNDSELSDYYRSLDIMIAPGTVQHGAPHYPVMEAMACGVPVVTTGYLPADSANSWIVEVGSSSAIVDAVNEIISDIEYTKKVKRASNDIREFSWGAVSKKMLKILIEK